MTTKKNINQDAQVSTVFKYYRKKFIVNFFILHSVTELDDSPKSTENSSTPSKNSKKNKTPEIYKKLAIIVGEERVSRSRLERLVYSHDLAPLPKEMSLAFKTIPDIVVKPRNATDVSRIVKYAVKNDIPITPRGGATWALGGAVPAFGGIVLDMGSMQEILEINKDDLYVTVEAGADWKTLHDSLLNKGLLIGAYPSSAPGASVAGWVNTGGVGIGSYKYGGVEQQIRSMEVVLPNGNIINTGWSNVVNNSSGYNLNGLFVGSEGTLGIATKLVLHIIPKPEATRTLLAIFDNLDDASQAVSDIVSVGIIPAALELMDKTMCGAIEQSVAAGYPVDAEGVLLIEVTGLSDSLDRQVKEISGICQINKVRELRLARTTAEYEAIWKGRKGAFGSVARICPPYLVNDGTVPRNRLVPALRKVNELAEKYHLIIANVAHAGDGNLHPLIMFDKNNPEEATAARKAGEEVLDACIALGGTISGEHGVGFEKLQAMRAELEAESRSLKEEQANLENSVVSLEEKLASEELKKEKAAIEELKNRNKAAKEAIAELEQKKKKLENKLEDTAETPEPAPKKGKAKKEKVQPEEVEVVEEAAEPAEAVVEEVETDNGGVTVTAIDDEVLVEEEEAVEESPKKEKKKRRFF